MAYGYKLDDFFRKSWLQGGLTIAQTFYLFDRHQDEKYRDHRFLAAIQGINLDKELKKTPSQTPTKEQQGNFIFGDPTEYEKLTEDERVVLTSKMMGEHHGWARNLNVNI